MTQRAKVLFFAWSPPLLLMSAIVALSSREGSSIPMPWLFPHQDKVLHAIAYAILGSLLTRALWCTHPRLQRGAVVLVSVCIISAFGSLDEFHQSFVPYRTPEVFDWVADCVGGLFGSCLAWWVMRRISKPPNA